MAFRAPLVNFSKGEISEALFGRFDTAAYQAGLAKARNVEPSTEESALQAKNVVLAGTSVVSGQGRGVVFATGMHTEFGRIAHLTQTAGATT